MEGEIYMEQISKEELLKYYSICTDQLKYYNTLIWQFPTALVTFNLLALNFFRNNVIVLLGLVIFNFGMLYILLRHIKTSKAIIASTQKVEFALEKYFGELIPKFGKPFIRATFVIMAIFYLMNIALIIFTIYLII